MKIQLPNDYKDTIINLARDGYSVVEILKALGITKKQHMTLMTENEEYSDAFERSSVLFEAWWREQGRINLHQKTFNYTAWYKHMINEFKWRDNPQEQPKDTDEAETRVAISETASKYIVKKPTALLS